MQSSMNKCISRLQQVGKIEDQNEANAMFRVVLVGIGKDFSDYKEEDKKNVQTNYNYNA